MKFKLLLSLPLIVTGVIAAAVTIPLTPSLWLLEHVSGYIAHPALLNNALTFDFPPYPKGDWVNYLDVQYGNNFDISGYSYLTMTIRITTTGAPNFRYDSNPNNTCSSPARVRPYFAVSQSNSEYNSTGRWWSNPVAYQLAAGTVTLSIPLTPDAWSDVDGQFGNLNTTTISRFAATKSGVREIGMTFGGGCFFGHGVSVENGTAKFELLDYSVSNVAGPSILLLAPSTLPQATAGNTYTQAITASGGNPPYTFSLASGAGLPLGLSLSTAGIFSGTPTVAGNYPFTVQAQDSTGITGTQGYVLNVAGPSPGPCSYGISPGGRAFVSTGGTGTIDIVTNSSCSWTITNIPNWVTFTSAISGTGSGTATFQLGQNSGADLSAVVMVAGLSFTVEQQAASIPGLGLIGSIPHLAAEENWITTFTLVNKGAMAAQARFSLFSDPGSPLELPLIFPQQQNSNGPLLGTSIDRTLAANASLIIQTAGLTIPPVQIGSAQLAATNNVDGFAILHHVVSKQEAVVPLEVRSASSYLLAFDNTNGVVLGVAVQNVSAQAANIPVVIRDDTGAEIGIPGSTMSLAGNGHTSFVLSDPVQGLPVTANKRGTIEFDTPAGGQISVLAIRFPPPDYHFTSIPTLANVGTSGGSVAHLASGGDGWQTTFVLVNVGSTAAQATLSFFADSGNPLSLPLSFPQSGNRTATMASFVTQTLAAGATLMVQSAGSVNLVTGSAQLSTTGNVSGFAIFRHNDQEFAVPFETRNAGAYLVAFDNTNGTATAVAINNVSLQAVNVPVVIRDDTGAQIIPTDMIPLAANGHYAFTLVTDRYPATAGIRGTIEFDTTPGGRIGILAIRVPVAQTFMTFTSLPAMAK